MIFQPRSKVFHGMMDKHRTHRVWMKLNEKQVFTDVCTCFSGFRMFWLSWSQFQRLCRRPCLSWCSAIAGTMMNVYTLYYITTCFLNVPLWVDNDRSGDVCPVKSPKLRWTIIDCTLNWIVHSQYYMSLHTEIEIITLSWSNPIAITHVTHTHSLHIVHFVMLFAMYVGHSAVHRPSAAVGVESVWPLKV